MDAPYRVPGNTGIPQAIMDLVVVVPFNDLAAVARALAAHRGRIAGMIVEPVMMNAGIIPPDDGYLAGLRDLLHAEGALLTFDEVKTGFTTGPAGATGRYGVVPDLVCLAKALGGGIPVAAIGGTEAIMSAIADGRYEQVGTFNGNPLAMAATRANLSHVLDEAGYAHLDALAARARTGIEGHIAAEGLDWRVVSVGAKGCVAFTGEPVRNYRDFLEVDDRWGSCTGCCSTMVGCSSHPGARSSSGCSRCSTPTRTSTASSPTSADWRGWPAPKAPPDDGRRAEPGRADQVRSATSSPSTASTSRCPRASSARCSARPGAGRRRRCG